MSRKRIGVTETNFNEVDIYFHNMFKSNRAVGDKSLAALYKLQEAKENYYNLPKIVWSNKKASIASIEKRRKSLNVWINDYIAPYIWERCLKTLRQNRSRKKLKLKKIDLPYQVYSKLKLLSQNQKIPIVKIIEKNADSAIRKMLSKQEKTK
jgi:macrodomain Ter protein organizer (MatP/YcbG family)